MSTEWRSKSTESSTCPVLLNETDRLEGWSVRFGLNLDSRRQKMDAAFHPDQEVDRWFASGMRWQIEASSFSVMDRDFEGRIQILDLVCSKTCPFRWKISIQTSFERKWHFIDCGNKLWGGASFLQKGAGQIGAPVFDPQGVTHWIMSSDEFINFRLVNPNDGKARWLARSIWSWVQI